MVAEVVISLTMNQNFLLSLSRLEVYYSENTSKVFIVVKTHSNYFRKFVVVITSSGNGHSYWIWEILTPAARRLNNLKFKTTIFLMPIGFLTLMFTYGCLIWFSKLVSSMFWFWYYTCDFVSFLDFISRLIPRQSSLFAFGHNHILCETKRNDRAKQKGALVT